MTPESRPRRFPRSLLLRAPAGAALAVLAAAPAGAAEDGLVIFPEWPTLLVLLAFFVALRFVLQPVFFQPLLRVLDERRERIDGARERSEELSRRAEGLLTRYREAVHEREQSAEAERKARVAEARSEQARVLQEARAAAEKEVEGARGQIGESLDGARATLRQETRDLARQAAERILGRSLA